MTGSVLYVVVGCVLVALVHAVAIFWFGRPRNEDGRCGAFGAALLLLALTFAAAGACSYVVGEVLG